MFYTKENYEYLLSILKEYNIYDFKTLTLKYNELTGSNIGYNTLRDMMNSYGFKMKQYKLNKIKELRELGLSNEQIGNIIGIHKNAVSRLYCTYFNGVKKRKRDFWKKKYFKERIIRELESNNYNLTKVANKIRCQYDKAIEILKYHGLYDLWRSKANIRDGSKIRQCMEYFKKYPNVKVSSVAKAVGCDYKVAWNAKKRLTEDK